MVLIYLILTFWDATAQTESNQISYSGVYRGEPLFVQNPYLPEKGVYCIQDIRINNRAVNLDFERSALMIDFSGISPFTPVAVQITYVDSTCVPSLVNPDAIKYHNEFRFERIAISDSSIVWETRGEHLTGSYQVQQYYLGSWEPLEIVDSEGVYGGASYQFFPAYEEGVNKYRIRYANGEIQLHSPEVEHVYYPEPITYKREGNQLILSRGCEYVITNEDNEVVLRGSGKEIDISQIGNGEFYMVFNEDQVELFRKNDQVKVLQEFRPSED